MSEKEIKKQSAEEVALEIISFDPQKDLFDVVHALNYCESAKKNPTKDEKEAVKALYDILKDTRHFVASSGNKDEVFQVMQNISKLRPVTNLATAYKQLQVTDENGNDAVPALVISKDFRLAVVLKLPKNVE